MSEEIRVMLVDDHESFRYPFAFMLGREPDLTVAAQAGSVDEARSLLEDPDLAVDVIIVDLDMPGAPGTDLIEHLHSTRRPTLALVLSHLTDRKRIAQSIEAGAAGVVHKSSPFEEVVDAIRGLHAGKALLSQQEIIEAVRLVGRERREEQEALLMADRLTEREREVLQALADGLGDKEIAERLYVGPGTVRTHMSNILAKLEVDSRLQALVFALRHGLLKIE